MEEEETDDQFDTNYEQNKYSSTPNNQSSVNCAMDEDDLESEDSMPHTARLYNNMNRIMNTIKSSASTFDMGR